MKVTTVAVAAHARLWNHGYDWFVCVLGCNALYATTRSVSASKPEFGASAEVPGLCMTV